ncbi:MAG: hypothetical protein RI591_07675 [Dehalococcoidia bacterium]|nr:hypothetical protein [Dehalococcoidia bacterium]
MRKKRKKPPHITAAQPLHGRGRQAALPKPQAPGRSPIGQGKATLQRLSMSKHAK